MVGRDEDEKEKPRRRLTQGRRETFLEVLADTGNRRMAAEAIGFEPRLMDQRRRYDPLLDRQWREALEAADRRLAGIDGPYDEEAGDSPVVVVKRGNGGRLQLQKAGEKRWSRAVEDRFFATLSVCGNISASARAVGFSQSCIDQRRRRWPDFTRRLEEALEDAEIEIEFRMAAEVRGLGTRASAGPGEEPFAAVEAAQGSPSPGPSRQGRGDSPFDMDAAMRFLKWREEKRRGGGRRGRIPAPPSIDDVTEKIVRKVEAIKRHRARQGGDSPPGEGGEGEARRG